MNKRVGRGWWLAGLCLLCLACATSFDQRGVYHRVRQGENLLWLSRAYGVHLQDLAELNNITDTDEKLKAGRKLYIPPKRWNSYKHLPFEGKLRQYVRKSSRRLAYRSAPKREAQRVYTDHNRFLWPVEGKVSSSFGIRNGRRHDGVDIRVRRGTPVRAASDGRVVYAGTMRGYGNLILLRHADNFFTAYAHNEANGVKEKQKVKGGEVIGRVGQTGRASAPHLHFEVREGEKARNPLFFLPVIR